MATWIEAAEDLIENETNRSIMQQTFRLTIPARLPAVELYRPDMNGAGITVTKVETFDGSQITEHDVEGLILFDDGMLPSFRFAGARASQPGRTIVEYTTGATDPAQVPAAIRQAVLLLASHWYRSREAISTDMRARAAESPLPFGVDRLIRGYRIPNVNVHPNDVE